MGRGSAPGSDDDGPLCCPFKFKLPVRPPAPLAIGVAAAAQAATCKSGSRSPGHQRRPGCVTLGPGPPCQSHSHGQLRTFKLRLLPSGVVTASGRSAGAGPAAAVESPLSLSLSLDGSRPVACIRVRVSKLVAAGRPAMRVSVIVQL